MWWYPENFKQQKPYLTARSKVMRLIRDYFDKQDFLEVETPILQVSPVMDTHIHAFATDIKGVDLQVKDTLYLHTSPEFAMKKLMVAGLPKIYQVCHVFRNAEGSRLHSPEFSLLEWYRAETDYTAMMDDTVGLLRFIAEQLEINTYKHKDFICDPFLETHKISVEDAFQHYADIDIGDVLEDKETFSMRIQEKGIRVSNSDNWDDLFFRVMAEKIEPYLGMGAPTILYDYPASMASLSRRKPSDPRYAERFEMYVCGVELCNAFSELNDAEEQRKRFEEEMALKQKLYGEQYPVDEGFLDALEYGLPDSSGNALGVDRLVMLATHANHIHQVLWSPVENKN